MAKWFNTHSKTLLVLWIVVFTITTMWLLYRNHQISAQGAQAHEAICDLKSDYRARIKETLEIIQTHPNGVFGISDSVLRNTVTNEVKTLSSLFAVKCNE